MKNSLQFYTIIILLALHKPFLYSKTLNDKNFSGTLTTLKDRKINVSDISFAHHCKHLRLYAAPANTQALGIKLGYNPRKCSVNVHLKDVRSIEVPYPYGTWNFKSCYPNKRSYLLLRVEWNKKGRKASYYLVEPRRRITLYMEQDNRLSPAKIPFSGLKKLLIQSSS